MSGCGGFHNDILSCGYRSDNIYFHYIIDCDENQVILSSKKLPFFKKKVDKRRHLVYNYIRSLILNKWPASSVG